MFSASAQHWRVAEAKRLGVNAYLIMPISAKMLLDRIVSILATCRPVVEPGRDLDRSPGTLCMV